MSVLTLENLQQFCRTCLKKQTIETQTKSDQQPQWYHIEKTENLKKWMEALKSVQEKTTYMLQKQYPQYVCRQCYQNFKQLYVFQEMVTDSYNVLTKLLQSGEQQQLDNNQHDSITVGEFIIKPKLEKDIENDFGMEECLMKSEYVLCDVDVVKDNVEDDESHKMMEIAECQDNEIKFNYQYRTPGANLTAVQPLSNNERLHKLEETQQYMQNDISIILENQSKMFELLSQKSIGTIPIFPIKTNEEIKKANDLIKESADTYVEVIRSILFPGSLKQNFHRLFATELILHYNFDGVSSKSSLKKYEYLINAIFEATKKDGYTYKEFTHDMRYSIRIVKNRHFKKLYDIKKKNGAS